MLTPTPREILPPNATHGRSNAASQMLRVAINGRPIWVTLSEWEALRTHGAADEIVRAIADREPLA